MIDALLRYLIWIILVVLFGFVMLFAGKLLIGENPDPWDIFIIGMIVALAVDVPNGRS